MERVTEANRARADEASARLPLQTTAPPPAPGPVPSGIIQAPAPRPRAPKANGRYPRSPGRAAREISQREPAPRVEPDKPTRVSMQSAVAAEQDRLRSMSTAALVKQAIAEVKLLARAEVLHAKRELQEQLQDAKMAGILLGICIGSGICGLSVLFVALALALPLPESLAALVVGGVLVLAAAASGAIGYRRCPKKPLQNTQQRLKEDLAMAREQFA